MYSLSEDFQPNDQNTQDKKQIIILKNKISNLTTNEFIEIFKIIAEDGNKYTENKNGIFINMSKLSNKSLKKLDDFVNFTIENKNNLENDIIIRENIKDIVDKNGDQNNSIINNQLNVTNQVNGTNQSNTSNQLNIQSNIPGTVESESYNNDDILEETIYDDNSETMSFDNNESLVPILTEIQTEICGFNNVPFNKQKYAKKEKSEKKK